MKTTLQLLVLATVFTTAASAAEYEQLPGHGGGLRSDGSSIVVADDFVLNDSIAISGFT